MNSETDILVRNLLAAIAEYRHWFDTCTRTGAPDWENRASYASWELDRCISRICNPTEAE
jgi:hypothetical protein